MLDLNELRAEFGRYLLEHTHTRWGLDAALKHVCTIAYESGIRDSGRSPEGYDPVAEIWTIEGVRYSGLVLKELAEATGGLYRFTRQGDVVEIEQVEPPKFEV